MTGPRSGTASRPATTEQPFRTVRRRGRGPVVPLSGSTMSPEDIAAYVRERLESRLLATDVSHGRVTLTIEPSAWRTAVRMCKVDPVLDCEFFDFLAGIDEREEGLSVLVSLYSVRHGHHVQLRAIAEGGREAPRMPSIADVYAGANWSERETYDMFGIDFEGHPGLEPRILTTEGFEGWPLRKEFLLTTREVKPWPGMKEPKEEPEEVVEGGERMPADTGPGAEDKAQLAKEKAERAKRKAAEMRARKAAERAAARGADEPAPTADGVAPEDSTPADHADRTGPEVRSQAAGMETGGPEGQPGQPSGAPGVEAEGRHGGAVEQSATRPAAETPGTGTPPGTSDGPERPGAGTPSGADEGPAGPPAGGKPGEPPAGEADASEPPSGQEERAARGEDDATAQEPADDEPQEERP